MTDEQTFHLTVSVAPSMGISLRTINLPDGETLAYYDGVVDIRAAWKPMAQVVFSDGTRYPETYDDLQDEAKFMRLCLKDAEQTRAAAVPKGLLSVLRMLVIRD